MDTDLVGPAFGLGTAVAPLAKLAVDVIRRGDVDHTLPGWVLPVLAAVLGVGFAILALVASGRELTGQAIATAVLAGPVAAGWALGLTEGQRWADRSRE